MKAFVTVILVFIFILNVKSQDYKEDEQEIYNLYIKMFDALIDKDWDQYQSFWIQDTTLRILHPSIRDWGEGWEAFKVQIKPYFDPDFSMNAELKINRFDVNIAPGGDFAWAIFEISVISNGHESQAWQVSVYRKVENEWKLNLALDAHLPPMNGSDK